MVKIRVSYLAGLCFIGLMGLNLSVLAQDVQGQMQSLSPQQLQKLEQARKAKKAKTLSQKKPASQQRSPAQATPKKEGGPKRVSKVVPPSKTPAKTAPNAPVTKTPVKVAPKPTVIPTPESDDALMTLDAPPVVAPTETMVRKRPPGSKPRPHAFFYMSAAYFSFADQIFAKVSGQKQKARSVFTGYSVGADYTRYSGRYIYSWNVNLVTGVVDIQRVLGTAYPRKSFWGAQSGPEIGYRVNSDMDLSWGVNLLYRDIENVGPSFALSNQANLRFRFSPRMTFFQSLGNYGKPTAYSYSIGLRWLL